MYVRALDGNLTFFHAENCKSTIVLLNDPSNVKGSLQCAGQLCGETQEKAGFLHADLSPACLCGRSRQTEWMTT